LGTRAHRKLREVAHPRLRSRPSCCLAFSYDFLPRPVDVAPAVLEPIPEKLVQVFSLNALQWTFDGRLHRIEKWRDIELPAICAERALRHGQAVPLSDPRRAKLRGHGGLAPAAAWCFDLDNEPSSSGIQAEPAASQFTRTDRGPAYRLAISNG
jgi:hypothetical protein